MRLTIKLKLGLTFAAIVALSVATAIFALVSLRSLNTTMENMVKGPVQGLQWSEELFIDLIQVVRADKNMILANTPEQIDKYDRENLASRQHFGGLFNKIQVIVSVEEKPKWLLLQANWQKFLEMDDKIRDFAKRNEPAKAQELSIGAARQLVGEV